MNRKVILILGVMFLVAALVAVSAPAKAEMYVEAYLGGVKAADMSSSTTWNYPTIPGFHDAVSLPGSSNASVLAGIKLGTWFVPTGFLGYHYPDWMKYFGFYADFSFHRLNVSNARGHATDIYQGTPIFDFPINFKSEGTVATLAFMFAARYGFLPDREVPFGRLQPYVAVGPAIMFSSQHASIQFPSIGGGISTGIGTQNSTNIALAVDAGIRYMCLKNVSIDLCFNYRTASPSYTFTGQDTDLLAPTNYKFEPTYNLFGGKLGVAYHF